FHDPELFVTHEGGATQQLELAPGRPGGFVAQVECGARQGKKQIEITASDAAGSTVLANFPVWCGAEPPRSITVDAAHHDVPDSAEAAERLLLTSVNRDRAAAGLPALVWDRAVAAVARGYSEEMRRTHLVAHISPTSGAAGDRVRAAGIHTGVVLENVARAYGIAEAHQALMNSPGHRANLMSSLATHVGIGVAFGDTASGRRELLITQVFTRVPPAFDRSQALAAVRRKLAAARPAPPVAALDALAQQLADGVAAGKSPEAAYQAISAQVIGLGKRYQRIGRMITAAIELDAIDGPDLLRGVVGDDLGLGLAQGPHPELGDNAIWIVLLYANRR
ncbi:MAG TPA: CAP domain-containing protein, partial [Kofleriaceae bacterium]|nr:CAP domain-containing protein [Kofleriaceae bacterium]